MSENQSKQENIRHSLAHLLARAVLEHYPEAKLTLGPAIDNGFYYDIDFESDHLSEDKLVDIEATMKKLLSSWDTFAEFTLSPEEAREFFSGNKYKLELINEIEETDEDITLYYSGPKNSIPSKKDLLATNSQKLSASSGFIDLCRGGHVTKPKDEIDPESFTLDSIAGAYWRGDENNEMLTRIYGLAFESADDLEMFLKRREEAKKRDHRKLGKQLDLFTFSNLVGSGLPLWTPKGRVLRDQLHNRLLEISKEYGMQPVTIPHIAKEELYKKSGHAGKFADELLKVKGNYDEFVLKPVNCPHHTQLYAAQPRSYRDLPIRYMETTMQYRDEKPGEIGGLTRVRSITVDDGHIFCRPDQIKQEAKNIAHIIEEFYTNLGLFGDHWVSLSVRDPDTPDAYIGHEKDWKQAEDMLQGVSDELELGAERIEGEAALYGPKLDYMFEDSLGREWQLATIQIDFAMPKRFNLTYTDSDNNEKTAVMIHRAVLGSYERFIAVLIEHFAGDFPFWLAPVQLTLLPIANEHRDIAQKIKKRLEEAGFRINVDISDDSLSKRIRGVHEQKIPYLIVIGDDEIDSKMFSIESRSDEGKNFENIPLDDLVDTLKEMDSRD